MRLSRRGWVALIVLLIASCNREPSVTDGPLLAEVSVVGDTTIVRNVSGSRWERPARLVEELRIGSLEGGPGPSFGEIKHVAVASDGSIFVYDPQVPQIYRFDRSGAVLERVGGEGEGPGEYTGDVTGMIVDGERLLVADADNARLSAFSLDGAYLGSLGVIHGLRSLFAPALSGIGDALAVRVVMVPPQPGVPLPTPWPIGFERRSPEGTIRDTVPPQVLLGEPADRLVALPSGGLLVSTESDFVFELRHRDGEVVRVYMPLERVGYTPAELRTMGRALAPAAAADGETEASLAALKPAYLEYLVAPEGRIFARRAVRDSDDTVASWRFPLHQPSVLDVFEPDGTYLGVVPVPEGSRPVVVTVDHLYVVELGEFDEPYLMRYRVDVT